MFKRKKGMPAQVIASFCRQLSQLLKQGIGLRTALLLIHDINRDRWGEQVYEVVSFLDKGVSLGEAMQRSGLPRLFTSFVMAGEQHGGLAPALEKCAAYYARKHHMRQHFMKALIYPAMVMLLMLLAFILLQTLVLPRFRSLYDTLGMELPWYTQVLLAAHEEGLKILFLFAVMCISIGWWLKKRRWEQVSMRLPIIREAWQLRFTSVFSWQLGLLLQAGIPLIQSFELIIAAWPWKSSRQAIYRVQERLKKGFSLQVSFEPEAGRSFHAILPRQLALGESSGMVAETLLYSGEWADERLEERIQWVLRVWEPVLILGIGVLLAAMVLALFVPMLSLVEGL